jgi:hypothetical protein
MKKVLLLLLLGAGLQATAAEPGRPAEGIAPPTRLPDPVVNTMTVPATEATPVTVATLPRELRRVVVADAAKHFNVSENSVVLTGAEQVTWSDGSLGCPRSGMSYTQALVPGYRLVARTAERELVYHTDSSGRAVRCEEPVPARGQRPPDGAPGNDAQPRTQPPTPAAPDR